MKRLAPLLLPFVLASPAVAADGVAILRRIEAKTGVVWDMPPSDATTSLPSETGSPRAALYQKWTIDESRGQTLTDQWLAGSNFPSVRLRVRTLDPAGKSPRTRVDQPFKLEIEIAGLLSDLDLPLTASRLLIQRHLVPSNTGTETLRVPSGAFSSAYLRDNGRTMLPFTASALTAKDPTMARGEELFEIHTLSGVGRLPTQLASARVQVLPVASGTIHGIRQGDKLDGGTLPQLTLTLTDLYPRSASHLLLFKGRQINGVEPVVLNSCVIDSDSCENRRIQVGDLASKITSDGFHTLALVSDTIYGRELLCEPVTFQANHPQRHAAELAHATQP